MANAALIYVLLLANAVRQSQTSITSVGATVNESRPADRDFALQIQTSPAPPASGNNLSDGTAPRKVTSENFQAISTNYSGEDTNKKQDDRKGEGAVKSDSAFYKKLLAKGNNAPADNPLSVAKLVWDNCETLNKDSDKTVVKQHQYDMEYTKHDIQHEVRRQEHFTNDGVKKRDTNSTAMTMWLEKYHNLLNPKSVEWKKQRTELNVVFESEVTTIPSTTKTTVKIIPLTTRLINKDFDKVNVTVELTTENNNMKGSYTEDWFDIDVRSKSRKTKIQFGVLPQRETYLVPTLKLEEGFYPFSFMPTFFDIIHPMDLPAGLIRDFVWGKLDFPFSFLQAIKVESAFLVFVIVFACLALVIPSYLIVVAFLSLISGSGDDEMETGALFPEAEETDCSDRVLAVVTAFMVLICCMLISGMVLSNEQATSATTTTRDAAACLCADLATWLTAAARELHHSLVPPVDMVLQAYRDDLRNVETLLGDPIQKTIASESGIDLALESLNDVISESEDLAGKISSLRDISMQAGGLASAASDRLTDLARQLDNVKKHCVGKDVKLCDTLNSHSMEFRMKFDSILRERQLTELRSFGVEELTRAIGIARHEFRSVPSAISAQTSAVRENIFKDMETHRQSIYHSSRVLSDIVRYLTAMLQSASRKVEAGLTKFQDYEFWRWVAMLGSTILFALVMTLILFAMMCGCGHAKGHAKRTLKISAVWMCVTSFVLWSMISAVFLIAGHAEVFVCHALWESPQYKSLSSLLDRPSPLLNNEEGVFDAIFRDLENVTIDVSVRDVLRDCEKDRPAYTVFQLDKVLDVNKETSYFEWDDLQLNLARLASSLDVGVLRTVSAELSRILNQMLIVSDVDLAQYRVEYNGPVVGKDMISLADQLQNVAAQVSDLTTSSRLESLATRTQRLYLTSIKPLEQLKADVVFKLTELELQLLPFRRKLNISLSHIHTAQFYIDNQGDVIAQKKGSIYASRLISHVAGWRTHVLEAAATQAGRCRPLFAVYSAVRALVCSRYVASLHGWWVCGLFLGLSWCALTPLCVNLWRAYGRRHGHDAMHMSNLTSGCQETPTTALCESNNWNTPGPPPPPRSDSW